MTAPGWWRDKIVLVTGASSGLGAELAGELHRRGARLMLTGRDEERVAAVAHPLGARWFAGDLASDAAIARLCARFDAEFSQLDVLINNAGVQFSLALFGGDLVDLLSRAEAEVAINLLAPFRLIARAAPAMARSPAPLVVNIGSGLGIAPKRSAPMYSATKAGLRALSLAVGFQGAQTDPPIRSVHVTLPLVATPMTAGRGRGKIAPRVAAINILDGITKGKTDIAVGKARMLPLLQRLWPGKAQRLFAQH